MPCPMPRRALVTMATLLLLLLVAGVLVLTLDVMESPVFLIQTKSVVVFAKLVILGGIVASGEGEWLLAPILFASGYRATRRQRCGIGCWCLAIGCGGAVRTDDGWRSRRECVIALRYSMGSRGGVVWTC